MNSHKPSSFYRDYNIQLINPAVFTHSERAGHGPALLFKGLGVPIAIILSQAPATFPCGDISHVLSKLFTNTLITEVSCQF